MEQNTSTSARELLIGADVLCNDGDRINRHFTGVGQQLAAALAESNALGNNRVAALPDNDVIVEFLAEYPFFRADGVFSNGFAYLTSVSYDGASRTTTASFDDAMVEDIRTAFFDAFRDADVLHFEELTYEASYHYTLTK